eukprot:CAMPEP_0202896490 /NCGR_PEP_ID=MMETSP1392-20130828/5488_1 /ASSEMBLY_ACC=CAM_ASM_000868 /TAXON_ID=225041 /ORGANISM="Chlamydomonas chlamydogama, Strain SAG 11-48b" /LENGTH=115 /DNA_ID=CAMNT_0049581867 /DNA_START=102 /DNA_END=446 /DNA_ORIENTATION=+
MEKVPFPQGTASGRDPGSPNDGRKEAVCLVTGANIGGRLKLSSKTLGKGAYATVRKALWDGEEVAVKILLPIWAPGSDDQYANHFLREGQFLLTCNHMNIIRALAMVQLPATFPG